MFCKAVKGCLLLPLDTQLVIINDGHLAHTQLLSGHPRLEKLNRTPGPIPLQKSAYTQRICFILCKITLVEIPISWILLEFCAGCCLRCLKTFMRTLPIQTSLQSLKKALLTTGQIPAIAQQARFFL